MKYALHFFMFLFIIISFRVSGQVSEHPPAQEIPKFQFFKLNGSEFTQEDLQKGRILFLMFIDPDCTHCQHAMEKIGEEFTSFKNTFIYIVSMDTPEKINHFMDAYGYRLKGQKNVTLLQDKLHQFIGRFNPLRFPAMYVYSSKNKLLDYEDNPESVFRIVNTINKSIK